MKRVLTIFAIYLFTQIPSFSRCEETYNVTKSKSLGAKEREGKTIRIKTTVMETQYEYISVTEFKSSDNSQINEEILRDSYEQCIDNLMTFVGTDTGRKLIILKNTQDEVIVVDRKEGIMDIYTGIFLFDAAFVSISIPLGKESNRITLDRFKKYLELNLNESSEYTIAIKSINSIDIIASQDQIEEVVAKK